ncbi:Glycine-rich RNA-binding protein 2, mitochondrial [Glycine soja]|nr:Glycine-rich RNA-binding protein 2, mitochondrial [Glycine soja]
MKLWSTNEVRAKSKFWYFLRKLKKEKKSNDQVLAINQDTIKMAFCNKVGNVSRQSVAHSTQAPVSSMLNYIRCMSSSKLFNGGLSYGVDDQSLKDAFSGFGDVVDGKFGLLSLLSHGVQFQPPVSLTLPYVLQFPLMSL